VTPPPADLRAGLPSRGPGRPPSGRRRPGERLPRGWTGCRIGELMKAQKDTVGLNRGAKGSKVTGSKRYPVKDERPSLSEAGIDKRLADRAPEPVAAVERVAIRAGGFRRRGWGRGAG